MFISIYHQAGILHRISDLSALTCQAESTEGSAMKKVLLAAISAVAVAAVAPADAADLGRPVYKAAPPATLPVPPFTWTGCYIGGHVGWGWGRETVSIPNLGETTGVPALEGVSLGPVTGDTNGFLGGGQIGCNYQFAPNWVIGIEGDGSAADIKGDVTESFVGPTGTVTGTAHAQTDWIASATGRLGWAWDSVLLYAKGGAAWAGDKYSADLPAFDEHIETSVTRPGWTVGGGVEWAFWDNWSAKVEYDFYDFGINHLTLPGTISGVPEVVPGIDIKEKISAVKFGVNYRFGPVVNGAY